MASLAKMWVAHYYDSRNHVFKTDKIVAPSFAKAEEIGKEWGDEKYPGRVKKTVIERSKGEVVVGYY